MHPDDKRRCDLADADKENSNEQKAARQGSYEKRVIYGALDVVPPEKVSKFVKECYHCERCVTWGSLKRHIANLECRSEIAMKMPFQDIFNC